MRLLHASDIHLNFVSTKIIKDFSKEILTKNPDSIVLTGDISEAPELVDHLLLLNKLIKIPIYFILGNHDRYGGSISQINESVRYLERNHPTIIWLDEAYPIKLTDKACLIGIGGWGDGREGKGMYSNVLLSDWEFIKDFKDINAIRNSTFRVEKLKELADNDTKLLSFTMDDAIELGYKNIYIATHVPPFLEASLAPDGSISDPDWSPWFVNQSLGDYLREIATLHTDINLHVLAGHTHTYNVVKIYNNLTIEVAGARYGHPSVSRILEIE